MYPATNVFDLMLYLVVVQNDVVEDEWEKTCKVSGDVNVIHLTFV